MSDSEIILCEGPQNPTLTSTNQCNSWLLSG
uniref:Uncharacterized protein n=1 Tax=Anguilla anguilla TaxID=7936 RepID=A0A0E9T7P5_ANGAN